MEKEPKVKANIPLVSVLIRTCQRPEVLRAALDSVVSQTYPNIQVVIVEDGLNAAQEMIEKEYRGLPYIYKATGKRVGRCEVGNQALALAEGKYFNFLDDDDSLFPDHVQRLVNALEASGKKAAYGIAEERQVSTVSYKPHTTKIKRKFVRYRQPFHRLLLYTENYIPIQSMMFHRSLYEQFGGFDPKVVLLEDWDLWVRYSVHTDFLYVNRITSCYHTPYSRKEKCRRSKELKKSLVSLQQNFKDYQIMLPVEKIQREMRYVIREYKDKGAIRYLRIFFRLVIFGER